jgi:hypothetical protein
MDDATPVSVTIDIEDIARIRADLGLDRFTSASFSTLFVLELHLMRYARVVSAPDVLTEIAALEGVGPPSRTKPPTQFKRPPLAPLWHKHFFAANAILHNLKNQWGGGWLEEQIGRHFAQSESGFFDDAMAIRTPRPRLMRR